MKVFGAPWGKCSIYQEFDTIDYIRRKHGESMRQASYMHIDLMGDWHCDGSNHYSKEDACEPILVDRRKLKACRGDIIGLLDEVGEQRIEAMRAEKWRTEGLYLDSGETCCALVSNPADRDHTRIPCKVLPRRGYRTCEFHAQYENAARVLYGDVEDESCEVPSEVEQSL